jgi:subtilisin family serine protease
MNDTINTATSAVAATPFHGLWHLQQINWLEGLKKAYAGECAPSRVFLIDVGVHLGHPYLARALDRTLAIDFSAFPFGLAYSTAAQKTAFDTGLPARLGLTRDVAQTVSGLIAAANQASLKTPLQSAYHTAFPSHGTACAGLIGACPPNPAGGPVTIPYFGVDPFCTIVPVSTSLNPTPGQLILALLYAVQHEADVIHMPRGVFGGWDDDTGQYDNPGLSLSKNLDDRALWEAFEAVMYAVSRGTPIICAAGNSGEAGLAYPASLSLSEGDNGIISVGAINNAGYRSSFSNYGEGLSLTAPSDDASVFNRYQIRMNKAGRRYQSHDYAGYVTAGLAEADYGRNALLTTDIPGRAGYTGYNPMGDDEDDDSFSQAHDPLQGMFTLFGGTSGASSIVAGVASLMVRRARLQNKKLDGPEIKAKLIGSCGQASLKTDNMNGENPLPSIQQLFGGGQVDVDKAVTSV